MQRSAVGTCATIDYDPAALGTFLRAAMEPLDIQHLSTSHALHIVNMLPPVLVGTFLEHHSLGGEGICDQSALQDQILPQVCHGRLLRGADSRGAAVAGGEDDAGPAQEHRQRRCSRAHRQRLEERHAAIAPLRAGPVTARRSGPILHRARVAEAASGHAGFHKTLTTPQHPCNAATLIPVGPPYPVACWSFVTSAAAT
eukprot:7148616-Prymnesium_polylepis.2